jgi:hypothetical protein
MTCELSTNEAVNRKTPNRGSDSRDAAAFMGHLKKLLLVVQWRPQNASNLSK